MVARELGLPCVAGIEGITTGRLVAEAEAHTGYNAPAEKQAVLETLKRARTVREERGR